MSTPALARGDIVQTPRGRLAIVRNPEGRDGRALIAYLSDDVPPVRTTEEVMLKPALLKLWKGA